MIAPIKESVGKMDTIIIDDEKIFRETVPGTEAEEYITNKIRRALEKYTHEVITVKTPVLSWIEKECYLEINGEAIKCHAMPYVGKTSIKAHITFARFLRKAIVVEKEIMGKIVFVPTPKDLDSMKYLVLELALLGAFAVGFYDILGGRYRRKVITGGYYYNPNYGSPPPIPVISVRREDIEKVKNYGGKAELNIDTTTRYTIGKTIIGVKQGANGKTIHITAHHDHWFTGYRDDLAGVEAVLRLARKLRQEKTIHNIQYILFTAEESGAPNYADWYWGWGSKYLLNIMKNTGELENIVANINIDCIDKGIPCFSGNPVLQTYAELAGVKTCGYDDPDFDSFQYTLNGIPAATLEELDTMLEIYHTDHDKRTNADPQVIDRYVGAVYKIISALDTKPLSYDPLRKYILGKTGALNLGVETRRLLGVIDALDNKIGVEKAIKTVTSALTNILYEPGISGLFHADIIPETRLLEYVSTELHYPARIRLYALDGVVADNVIGDKEKFKRFIRRLVEERINLYLEKLESKLCISV